MARSTLIISILCFIQCNSVSYERHLARDVVCTHIIPSLDTETLFNSAMALNVHWSLSAARALSSQKEYLTLKQMKVIKRRICSIMDRMNVSTEVSVVELFADFMRRREIRVMKFRQNTQENPIRIQLNSSANDPKHFIFKMDYNALSWRYHTIVIDAIIELEQSFEMSYRLERRVTSVGSHPLIRFEGSKVTVFPSYKSNNKLQYHMNKREEFEFVFNGDQRIDRYEIRIQTQRIHMQHGAIPFYRHNSVGYVHVPAPAQLIDVFAVKLSLQDDNNCFCLNPFTQTASSNECYKHDRDQICRLCTVQ